MNKTHSKSLQTGQQASAPQDTSAQTQDFTSHNAPQTKVRGVSAYLNRLFTGPYGYWITVIAAFIESIFSPIPPDIGIIAVSTHTPRKAYSLALWCTIASVLGGMIGYGVGAYIFETMGHDILKFYGLSDRFHSLGESYKVYGFWIILLKGFTPIPYKLVTITSGAFHFNFWAFTLASVCSRGMRFFGLAYALSYFGPKVKPYMDRFIGIISCVMILLAVVFSYILSKL